MQRYGNTTIVQNSPRRVHKSVNRCLTSSLVTVPECASMTTPYLLAIDQGTTSTRAVVCDATGRTRGIASRELTQHYPRPGWVEHDAEEIWSSVAEVVPRALGDAGIEAAQLTALGLTNQRETVVLWERDTGRPVARAIVWQDRRTSDFCQAHQGGGIVAARADGPGARSLLLGHQAALAVGRGRRPAPSGGIRTAGERNHRQFSPLAPVRRAAPCDGSLQRLAHPAVQFTHGSLG